ncbi:MAG: hypothetical protein V1495_07650 [Pseudomonadota bacterium]
MARPDDPWGETSISKLAEEFLRQAGLKPQRKTTTPNREITERDGESRWFGTATPVTVATLNLFVFGSGFLYLRRPFVASGFLFFLLTSGTLLGSINGVLPEWISVPVLRELGWICPTGLSLLLLGGFFSFVWWLSIVLAFVLAQGSLRTPVRPLRKRAPLLLLSPFPMVGHFSQGRFLRGVLLGLFYFWVPLSIAGVVRLWNEAALKPIAISASEEPQFIWAVGVLVFSLVVSIAGLANSVVGALNGVGWLYSRRYGHRTEWKFVSLGVSIVLAVGLYLFAGWPGRRIRSKLAKTSIAMETRGLHRSGKAVWGFVRDWERKTGPLEDFLDRFR